MSILRRIYVVLLSRSSWFLMVCVVVSCEHKDLLRGQESAVKVQFDWSRSPAAAPTMMRLAIFATGAQPVFETFSGRDGGQFNIFPGTYSGIGFNSDAEMIETRGSSYEEFEVYSPETRLETVYAQYTSTRTSKMPKANGTDGQKVIYEPDYVWVGAIDKFEVYGVPEQTLNMSMGGVIFDYVFTITNVENLSYVNSAIATISGMSGSWYPAAKHASDTHYIIPFVMEPDGESTLRGRVRTFGHCPSLEGDNHSEHKLVVYAEMSDGSHVYYQVDITSVMHDKDHITIGGDGNTDVPIVIDELPLPKPMANTTGLDPHVSDWQEIEVDIHM